MKIKHNKNWHWFYFLQGNTGAMEKKRILQLATKSISGNISSDEMLELQNLLQKKMGMDASHKILLQLYNIQSLVIASEKIRLQKAMHRMAEPCDAEKNKTNQSQSTDCLAPRFLLRNNLFQNYCSLTLRQLNRILC